MSKTDDTSRTGAQSLLQTEATERRERPEITAPSGVDDRLRRRYRLALSLTGILTVVSLVLVLLELNSQKHDIPTVNSAGRQRMLSQKLAKAALQLSSADDPASRAKARDELGAALEQFVETQRHLELDAELHTIPNEAGDAVVTGLLQVRPHFAAIDHAVQRLLAVSSQPAVIRQPYGDEPLTESIAADVETILAHEGEFLEVMDELVGVYEGQAEAHSDRLLWILYGLASVFILVLLLEGVFIFEPAVRTIQRQIGAAARASAASAENTALKRAVEALKREIERRKTVEEQLRKSANEVNRLLKLAGQVRHSVVICDARGRIQYANEPYVRMTGYSLEELIGQKPGPLLQGEDTDPAAAAEIRRLLHSKEHFEHEILNYTKDGRPYWISLEVEPVFDGTGELQYFIGTHVDITQRKENERALEQARRTAEKASAAKSEFLARMSHEIRTPLNGILGFTELLQSREFSLEQQRSHLETVASCGRHLLQLIDDILDLSKIEAGKLPVLQEACSPHHIICEVLSLLRIQAERKGVKLECVWTTSVPETIRTDAHRLRQLLVNLVGNAIKFTESGGVTLRVAIKADDPEPRFVIEVHDTGVGIPPEHLEHIFEPFDQADTSITRRFGGTGLGLAICRHLAEMLGGDISATSKVGVGSTFRVTLSTGPLDDVAFVAEGMTEVCRPRTHNESPCDIDLSGRRILVCDDGATNRELIGLVLDDAGAAVEFAENGQQGIDAVTQHGESIDLILMDMQMPVVDGYSATRTLRQSGWTKPIVALTAHAMSGDEKKCRSAGCSGFESKPVQISRLLNTVAASISESSAESTSEPAPTTAPLPMLALSPTVVAEPTGQAGAPIHSTLPTEHAKFRKIVERFVDRLNEQIERMESCLDEADSQELAQLAHWLKGAGGTVGFDCFTEPARELEQAARDRQLPAADLMLQEIRKLQQRIELPWHSTRLADAAACSLN